MNTPFYKNLYLAFGPLALVVFSLPHHARAEVLNTPFLTNKICLVKYQAEVLSVTKLIDTKKATAKLLEIKSARKEEDTAIQNVFNKIDEKVSDQSKKETIGDKKELVLKAISDRRTKTDELQSSTKISKPEIETIVKSTLLEFADAENPKTCPIRLDTSKDIHAKNIVKLKKLAADKKEVYQKQTKEIQDDFNVELRSALNELSEEISNY